jgi:hypothetical protein
MVSSQRIESYRIESRLTISMPCLILTRKGTNSQSAGGTAWYHLNESTQLSIISYPKQKNNTNNNNIFF